MADGQVNLGQQLAETQQVIERQRVEIEQLRFQLAGRSFAHELQDRLLATGVAARIAAPAPHEDALERVVETAADVLNAEAASLFLVDEERDELVFQVALGQKAAEVRHFRVPLGHGIAGYVAATGQPLAVADAEKDSRFARDIGHAIDYIPRTLLCVPLFLDDRVIGVLELLDKAGGTPFSTQDIETLGRFANLAALAIEQSRLAHDLRLLFRELLADLLQTTAPSDVASRFADQAAESAAHADALQLAGLVYELSRGGDAVRRLTVEVLTSMVRHLTASSADAVRGA